MSKEVHEESYCKKSIYKHTHTHNGCADGGNGYQLGMRNWSAEFKFQLSPLNSLSHKYSWGKV